MAVIYTDQPLTIDPGFDGAYYSISLSFTGSDGLTIDKTLATNQTNTYTFTPSSEEFGKCLLSAASGRLYILCETTSGRRRTYDAEYILTLNESIAPSVESVTTEYTHTFNGKGVVGISGAYLKISLKGLYGAKQELRVVNKSGGQIDYKVLDGVDDNSVSIYSSYIGDITDAKQEYTIRVSDSRGRSTEKAYTLSTSYTYTKPSIIASVVWNSSGKPALSYTITLQTSVAGGTNKLDKVQVMYTDSTGKLHTDNFTDINKSGVPLSGTYDDAGSYNFSIKVTDLISYSTKVLTLEGNKPIIDIGADGNTVAIFCSAPNSADTKSVMIGEMGKITTKLSVDGLSMNWGNSRFVELGPVDDQDGIKYTLGIRGSGEKGPMSLVTGDQNIASGRSSTAGGEMCEASGMRSIAMGYGCVASGQDAIALGDHTIASRTGQIALGAYNVEDENGKYKLIIGNGESGIRKNALAVTTDGDLEINSKSVNSLHSGLAYHCYSSVETSTGTNNSTYVQLPCFKSKSKGSLSSLIYDITDYYIVFDKAGVYNVNVRFAYRCATQYKRFELAPFINDERQAYLCTSYAAGVNNNTLVDMVNFTIQVAARDTLRMKISPVDAVAVGVTPMDIAIIALDYEGKYK